MKPKFKNMWLGLVGLGLSSYWMPSPVQAKNSFQQSWVLENQFSQSVVLRFPRQRPTFILIGERNNAYQLLPWARALSPLRQKADILGIAHVPRIPMKARSMVKNMISKATTYPVLLDWQGQIKSQLGSSSSGAGIFLVDRQGKVLASSSGSLNDAKLKALQAYL